LSPLLLGGHMGLNVSSLWPTAPKTSPRNYTITMIGLDGAGKTTVLCKLKHNESPVEVVPTIGFNIETISLSDGINLCIMDIGGQDRIRDLWKHYFDGCQAIIFVVDSNDMQRFEEARQQLEVVLGEEKLKNAVLLVLANKQDITRAAPVVQVAEELRLRQVAGSRKWFIQGTLRHPQRGHGSLTIFTFHRHLCSNWGRPLGR